MKNLFLAVLFFISVHIAFGQLSAKIYEHQTLDKYVSNHKSIAILPMDVVLRDTKAKEKNRTDPEELKRMEKSYQETFQNSMYSWFLKMKGKGKISQEIQDVNKTNTMLKRWGIEDVKDLSNYTYDEIAKMLEVDGVFAGNVVATQSFSKGGAVALAVLTGVSVKTGDADVFIKLYDKSEGELLWSFDRTVASNYANTPEDVVDYLMKRVSKRFPYKN